MVGSTRTMQTIWVTSDMAKLAKRSATESLDVFVRKVVESNGWFTLGDVRVPYNSVEYVGIRRRFFGGYNLEVGTKSGRVFTTRIK